MATVMARLVLAVVPRRLGLLLRHRTVAEVVTAPLSTAAVPSRSEQPAIAGRPAWASVVAAIARASSRQSGDYGEQLR